MENNKANIPFEQLPDKMIESLEALRSTFQSRVKDLEKEFNRTVELMLMGFLSDKEIPEGSALKLDGDKVYFIKMEEAQEE